MTWRDQISQPTHTTHATFGIRVPMRDGTHLSVDIIAPDGPGPFPALLAYSPYWNEGQHLPVPSANPHPMAAWGNYAIEAGDSEYFASRGYVHVIANVRGTGDSEGEYDLMGPLEQQDGYDLIEWIAAQPWCDGNVGMVGVSYFSWIQYLIAAQQPPSLKTIAPLEGATDFYRDVCYRGGILSLGFLIYWNSELSDNDCTSRTEREVSAEELAAMVARVKETNLDIRNLYSVYNVLNTPKKNSLIFDALLHPDDGPWWHERSGYRMYDRIQIPVFCGAALDFWDLHTAGGFRSWDRLTGVPKKFLIYPRFHLRPFTENHDLLVRWYDHWLKGNDTGMLDEPPISMWVQGTDEWRTAESWPLPEAEFKRLHLRSGGRLTWDPPETQEGSDGFDNLPYVTLESTFGGVPRVTYATDPLEEDLEVSGPIALELFGSLSADDANWIVELRDVSPDGSSRIVSKGWLRAGYREIDEETSTPYRPEHPFTEIVPVTPGAVERYAIQIHDTSNVFRAGHRIELIVKSVDHSLEGEWNTIFYHLPHAGEVRQTVHHDGSHPSHLLIPVVPSARR